MRLDDRATGQYAGAVPIGWAALGGATLVVLFWVLYYGTDVTLGHGDVRVVAFESAFPFADALFAIALVLAGVNLLRRRAAGPLFLIGAAAMSLYLGVLDLTFYGRHGLYAARDPSTWLELGINAACIIGGIAGLAWAKRWWGVTHAAR